MKKVVPIICIISILVIALNTNKIANYVVNYLNHNNYIKLDSNSIYAKNNNYNFVLNTNNFIPYGKQQLLNIIYTVINNHNNNFTFYCAKEYKNCITDINDITNNADLLTHLNNFVHPYNSFTKIKTTIVDNGEINLQIDYLYPDEEIDYLNNEVNNLINTLITEDLNTDYDKIKVIHDYIINNTKYDLDNNNYSAYDALKNHKATCNGYTDLMAIFLTKMGYDNFKIATTNSNADKSSGHVWNAVKIDDEWLHLDLTWDDPVSSDNKDYLYHKYFLITTKELKTADNNITSHEHDFDITIYNELKEKEVIQE